MRVGHVARGAMTQGAAAAPPRVPLRAICFAMALAAAAYVGAAAFADWEAIRRAASAVPGWVLLAVLGLSLASYLLRFVRWQGFLRALGHELPWRLHLPIYLAGLALTVSPGKAGEAVRSVYLRPLGVPYAHSIAAFVCERSWDLAVVAALGSLAVTAFPAHWATALVPLAAAAAIVALARSRAAQELLARRATRTGAAAALDCLTALRALLEAPRILPALLPTAVAWTAQGISLMVIVHALGHPLPAAALIGIYTLSLLAGALSFIPGGLGTTEAAMVLMLRALDVPLADALYAALIARALPLWLAVALGVLAMGQASRDATPPAQRT